MTTYDKIKPSTPSSKSAIDGVVDDVSTLGVSGVFENLAVRAGPVVVVWPLGLDAEEKPPDQASRTLSER